MADNAFEMSVPAPKPVSPFRRKLQAIPGLGGGLIVSSVVPPLWWDRYGAASLAASVALFVAGAYAYNDPKARRVQQAIADGGSLMHWTYTAEERQEWAERAQKAGLASAVRQSMWVFATTILVALAATAGSGWGHAGRYIFLPAVLPLAVLWLRRCEVQSAYLRALSPAREVLINRDGFWADGRLFLFDRIREIEIVPGSTPFLRFELTDGDSTSEISVQIPRGHEQEAGRLLKQYFVPATAALEPESV